MATEPGTGVRSRLYNIWRCMRMRCYKPSHEAYPRYGGRGITVCYEWNRSFVSFRAWALEHGYADDLTIDRENNDKGYYPENCRWVTYIIQEQNKDCLHAPITAFGETKLIADWSRDIRCVVPYKALLLRLKRGRDPEWSITTPANFGRRRKPMSEETKNKIADKARNRQMPRNENGQFLKTAP